MSSAELQPHQLMQLVANFFESHGIPYRVVGSMASMAYGEPRFTNDVDIVAELQPEHVAPLCAAFAAPDFYVVEPAVRAAVARRFQFNIVHPSSGLKADVIVTPDTDFARSEARRIRRITSEGEFSVWFASPEDIILHKLIYYRLSGGVSDKHPRDIAGILKLQSSKLDRDYILRWAGELGVTAEWALIGERT